MKELRTSLSWNAVSDVLRVLVPQFAQSQRWREYRVWEVWTDVVGETLARKARPTKIHKGKLFVMVSNSTLMQELQFAKAALRDRLNAQLGQTVIRDILFVIGHVREREDRLSPPVQRPLPRFTELQIPALNNPELEAALTKLLHARRRRLLQKGNRHG